MVLNGGGIQNAMNCSMGPFFNQQVSIHNPTTNYEMCRRFYCNRAIQNAKKVQIAVFAIQNNIIFHNVNHFVIVIDFHFTTSSLFFPILPQERGAHKEVNTMKNPLAIQILALSIQILALVVILLKK